METHRTCGAIISSSKWSGSIHFLGTLFFVHLSSLFKVYRDWQWAPPVLNEPIKNHNLEHLLALFILNFPVISAAKEKTNKHNYSEISLNCRGLCRNNSRDLGIVFSTWVNEASAWNVTKRNIVTGFLFMKKKGRYMQISRALESIRRVFSSSFHAHQACKLRSVTNENKQHASLRFARSAHSTLKKSSHSLV